MKKSHLFFLSLLFSLMFVITSCSNASITVTPDIGTEAPVETTVATEELITTETVVPTEEPIIPCTITFESNRDGNREVYHMAPDGSETVNLTNNPAEDFSPAISPDGSQIAFVSTRGTGEEEVQFIYVMNADGSAVRQLTFNQWSSSPDWSHDGSQITYNGDEDIFTINADGSGEPVNLTNSEERDVNPTWSPDGSKIAWSSGNDGNWNLFVMDADGSNRKQITDNGQVFGAIWTIDGRLLTNWGWKDQQEFCHNCVVTADGSEIVDGGGKGTIVNFIPFVTADGERVELAAIDNFEGNTEIYILSDKLPDTLDIGVGIINLTNNPAEDTNADWPANCVQTQSLPETAEEQKPLSDQAFVFGYENSSNNMTPQNEIDLFQACNELQVQCVKGESITALTDQNVNAILSFTNRWQAMGSWPQIHDAVGRGILVIMLGAESPEPGAYNLSVENSVIRSGLEWMFKEMGGEGEFVYYNFGNDSTHQSIIDQALKDYPGVLATAIPASYDNNTLTEESVATLVDSNPDIEGIWADAYLGTIFWGVHNSSQEDPALMLCDPRSGMLNDWKNFNNENPSFKCFTTINPGGYGYEGVYVAYNILNGMEINPDALGGEGYNTFTYDYPIITNENLDEWLEKLNTLREGQWGNLETPAMTPDEIKEKWFLE